MPILTSKFTEIRPAMNGSIYHLDIPLGTVRILIDTGADKTAISHKFFLDNNIQSIRKGTTTTPYNTSVPTAIYQNISLLLHGDDGINHRLDFAEVESIIGSTYNFPVIIGMDVLSLGKFTLWGDKGKFTLVIP